MKTLLPRLTLVWAMASLTAVVGCAETQKPTATGGPSNAPTVDRSRCDRAGKREVAYDLNRDRRPDVWKLFVQVREGGQTLEALVCKEADLNFDGRKDYWAYYDEKGNLTLEELDMDFDGKIDFVRVFQQGRLVREEMDTDHDGRIDLWKYYEGDALARLERDTKGNGKIDYWEYYEGGVLDRIGLDKDGDGKVDVWERPPPPARSEEKEPPKPDGKKALPKVEEPAK
jgi:hypothetical protein